MTRSTDDSGSRGARASLAGEPDQVARAVDAHDVLEAAARQLDAVAALAAAQVEDGIVARDAGRCDDEVDLAARVVVVLDHVAVGFHVQRVEQLAPPLLGQMRLEIADGAKTGPYARPLRPLAPQTQFHPGVSSLTALNRAGSLGPPLRVLDGALSVPFAPSCGTQPRTALCSIVRCDFQAPR
jgi:hypothetical protein